MQAEKEFLFPFPPYEIQREFMKNLYQCFEDGKLGIFESPTGTGKSMSIICGALKWLLDHENHEKSQLIAEISELDEEIKKYSDSMNNWFSVQTERMQLSVKRQALQAKLNAILQFEKKRMAIQDILKEQNSNDKKLRNQRKVHTSKTAKKMELEGSTLKTLDSKTEDISTIFLLEDISSDLDSSEDEQGDEQPFKNTKIFICSRTHSQLSQLVGELKKSPYSSDISAITLASRQNYCINKTVRKLKHLNLINEQCLQLQRKRATVKKEKDVKKSKTTSGCPFMPGNQDLLMAELLTTVQDVEEIGQIAEYHKTCAYYASRKSVYNCQLILLPYNSILHKSTRISTGIDVKGNILIIDEAHNLLDAIERMHSAMITGRNLLHCYSQLSQYQKRFQTLFSAKSILYLSQLSFCLKKLLTIFGATPKTGPSDPTVKSITVKFYKTEDFEVTSEIDTINMFELLDFIKKSKLIHKLQGFVEQYGPTLVVHEHNTKKTGITQFLNSIKIEGERHEEAVTTIADAMDDKEGSTPLIPIVTFLECLKSSCSDGRICIIPGPTIGTSIMKYLLLNPAAHFHEIVRDARAVVLAGGTMEPMSEFTEQLFLAAGAPPERIFTFSCDHVIPQENILANIVRCGPSGIEFDFNFQNRQEIKLLDEVGRALVNICNIVPGGIVVFLPSYNYEETLYEHLDKSGIKSKIALKKCVFREPKLSSQVNQVLEKYATCIRTPRSPQNGALLFSVVGGKLSEGLNFSDDLGRCIIVVGMPYPNIKSPELQEKMKYLNTCIKPGAGQDFYENSCMKAVNQCIGRAVRHINDYSTVVLLDKRFSNKTKALPNWIQRALTVHNNFGSMIGGIAKFFNKKKQTHDQVKII